MGRKVTVYGYRFEEGILQADKEQSRFVQEIFNVYNSGISVSRLKDHIEGLEINRVKLNDMLSDKRYMGDENFPKIIEPELFEAVQQMKKERRKAIGKEQSYIYYKEYFLLGDKMKCGECGSEYHCYKHGDKQIWDCSKRIVKGRVHCRNQRIQEDQIKELFMQAVTKMKNDPEKIRKITVYGSKRNIRRLQAAEHEIELLKNDSSHNIDELLELIYKRASLQYEDSDDGGAVYYTQKIEDLIQQHKEQPEEKTFDKDLFDSIMEAITIYKDGRVVFTLKNGATITETL